MNERGFTVLETLVAIVVTTVALVAFTAHRGASPERRLAARALADALAQTRALAAANGNATSGAATGATLIAEPLASGTGTRLTIYAGRPIAGASPLARDPRVAPESLPVSFALANGAAAGRPFGIFVSSSGYASVAADYTYDSAAPVALAADPGCDDVRGETIAVTDANGTETHPFDCRGARYEADAP